MFTCKNLEKPDVYVSFVCQGLSLSNKCRIKTRSLEVARYTTRRVYRSSTVDVAMLSKKLMRPHSSKCAHFFLKYFTFFQCAVVGFMPKFAWLLALGFLPMRRYPIVYWSQRARGILAMIFLLSTLFQLCWVTSTAQANNFFFQWL